MKKKRIVAFTLVLSLMVLCVTNAIPFSGNVNEVNAASSVQLEPSAALSMYRLYNPNTGEHFYTSSPAEKSNCVAAGWNDEGIGWYSPSTSLTAATPVYRVYNTVSGEHYYTSSRAEADNIFGSTQRVQAIEGVFANRAGYYVDGIGNILTDLGDNGRIEDYELKYIDETGVLKDWCLVVPWRHEGVSWQSSDATAVSNTRAYDSSVTSEQVMIPVYCLWNPNCGGDSPASHHYTTSETEVEQLVEAGWQNHGVPFYAVPSQEEYEAAQQEASKETVTIDEDPGYAVIEAKVNLKDTSADATGVHAKVVMTRCNAQGQTASFGIQYEENIHNAYPQYQNNTVFLCENVFANSTTAGKVGKHYMYLKEANLGTEYKIRLSWTKDDNMLHCYVNDHEINTVYAKWSVTDFAAPFNFQVEASGAHNGDKVEVRFSDIKVRVGDGTETRPIGQGTESTWQKEQFFGLSTSITSLGTAGPDERYWNDTQAIGYNAACTISGTVEINPAADWDTCFGYVDNSSTSTSPGTSGHPISATMSIPQQQTNHGGWVPDGEEAWH